MSNIEITRDIVVAALNGGYPKVVKASSDGSSINYVEAIKTLIEEVHTTVKRVEKE